jgi:hypothetical protein
MRPELVRVVEPHDIPERPWERAKARNARCPGARSHGIALPDRWIEGPTRTGEGEALAFIRKCLLEAPGAVGWVGDGERLEFYRLAIPDETTDETPLVDCVGTLIPFSASRPRRMVALEELAGGRS